MAQRGLQQLPMAMLHLQETTAPAFFRACLQVGNGLWKQTTQCEYPKVGGTQLRAESGEPELTLGSSCILGKDLNSTRAPSP